MNKSKKTVVFFAVVSLFFTNFVVVSLLLWHLIIQGYYVLLLPKQYEIGKWTDESERQTGQAQDRC